MKKIFLSFIAFILLSTVVFAENFPPIKYKKIGNKGKVSYNADTNVWSDKIDKKQGNYFVKVKGFGDFYDYLDSNKEFAFSTGCEYEFLYNDKLIGYSNKDLNFYELQYADGNLKRVKLTDEDVKLMLPDFKVLKVTDFSKKTNSIKIKKHISDLDIVIINDTDKDLSNYVFTSGNAKFKTYSLNGFITVLKHGMIQFAPEGDEKNTEDWLILLVR